MNIKNVMKVVERTKKMGVERTKNTFECKNRENKCSGDVKVKTKAKSYFVLQILLI